MKHFHPAPSQRSNLRRGVLLYSLLTLAAWSPAPVTADAPKVEGVEIQPLAAQVRRLIEAMDYLGEPLSAADKGALARAVDDADEARAVVEIQRILDKRSIAEVHISPESRVKVIQGGAEATLAEAGWRTFLVKVRNEAGVTAQLKAESPNALPVFARGRSANIPGGFSLDPIPSQTIKPSQIADRWLDLAMFDMPPLQPRLSGLALEYRIIQLYSRDRGRREAQLAFNVGQGTQDIGFRNDVAILFSCRPSKEVTLRVRDENNRPTTASFIIRDAQNRVYPSRSKRLAPDFAFHPQIYRADGERVRLPAGEYVVEYTRGPEYLVKRQTLRVGEDPRPQEAAFRLERWINPAQSGWYSGDHHIHAAGCAH